MTIPSPSKGSIQNQNISTAAMEVDYDTNVTKLYECISNSDWDSALLAIKRNHLEAQIWVVKTELDSDNKTENLWRFLPIHSACARRPPASVISALLLAYPEGVQARDDQGMYPIHYACANQASVEVIDVLLQAFPDGVYLPSDMDGMLPIHIMSIWGPSSLDALKSLLAVDEFLACAEDLEGSTPLDLAIGAEDYSDRTSVVKHLHLVSMKLQEPDLLEGKAQGFEESKSAISNGKNTAQLEHVTSLVESVDNDCAQVRDPWEEVASERVKSNAGAMGKESNVFNNDNISKMSESSQITAIRLQAEINKITAELDFDKINKEELIEHEWKKTQNNINITEIEIRKYEAEAKARQDAFLAKQKHIEAAESRFAAKESKCRRVKKQNESLRQEIETLTSEHNSYISKVDASNKCISTESIRLGKITKEQQRALEIMIYQEDGATSHSAFRQRKLEEMIKVEDKVSQFFSDPENQIRNSNLNKMLEAQKMIYGKVTSIMEKLEVK